MSKKILIITGDAGETYECLFAKHRLLEAGFEPVIAAPTRKPMHLVIHDFEPGWDTYIERPGYRVESDITFDQVKHEDYEAILVLGGRAPEYLRHNEKVLAIVKAFHAQERWIFAICHGIQVLVSAGIVKGRKLTCYEHCRHEVEAMGGTWETAEAVRDGHLVTAQTWNSHPEFYREIFNCLTTE